MAHSIKMPKVAMAMNEGIVAEWLIEQGQAVKKGDFLLTIETEKTAYEVESTGSGILHIVVARGETVPIHTEIALLAESEEELQSLKSGTSVAPDANQAKQVPASNPAPSSAVLEMVAKPEAKPSPPPVAAPPAVTPPAAIPTQAPPASTGHVPALNPRGQVRASPPARRIAKQGGFDLSLIPGTGPWGRIKKRDIETWLANGGQASQNNQTVAPQRGGGAVERERIPVNAMRNAIRSGMMHATTQQAMCSGFIEIEMEALLSARQTYVQHAERLGTKTSLQAFFIKAMSKAALDVPNINSRMEGEEIIVFQNVDVSLAVAVEGGHALLSGLTVPVLTDANLKGLVQIDREMKELIDGARAGASASSTSSQGTITLSSVAGIMPGYSQTTPILNSGQGYIGQPGNVVDRAVVRDGVLVPGKIMTWSYSFDHRVIDGVPVCEFHTRLKEYLEHPELLVA